MLWINTVNVADEGKTVDKQRKREAKLLQAIALNAAVLCIYRLKHTFRTLVLLYKIRMLICAFTPSTEYFPVIAFWFTNVLYSTSASVAD